MTGSENIAERQNDRSPRHVLLGLGLCLCLFVVAMASVTAKCRGNGERYRQSRRFS
jgi:hypothetical protein